MKRHSLFLRWWLIVTLIGIGALIAHRFGVFREIYDKVIAGGGRWFKAAATP